MPAGSPRAVCEAGPAGEATGRAEEEGAQLPAPCSAAGAGGGLDAQEDL